MKKLAGCLAALAAASLVAIAPSTASAQTCEQAVADGALHLITNGGSPGTGARFVTAAVQWAFDLSSSNIDALWGSTSPSSALYYDNITTDNYFTWIDVLENVDGDMARADNIAAGDILTIDAVGAYAGHSVVILDAPEVLSNPQNPIVAGTTQWLVKIADHTSSTHGCLTIGSTTYGDSRGCGTVASPFTSGTGTAYIRLYTDASGNFTAYNWRVNSSNTSYYDQATRPHAIGRVTPCPLPAL
ncbi:MAG TPA: hypothetical protein VLS89_18085 [Candidatus Nanopelagicales bacterium]|nr:hypothetical protein [Candidatus Nanopelagicales bacterium]